MPIPNGVTSIGVGTFEGCTRLTGLVIPNGVTDIGGTAFGDCASLTSMAVGDNVTSIGPSAFSSCAALTNLTLGTSITNIGYAAFAGCTNLSSVTIPSSATNIGDYAFAYCFRLTGVFFEGNRPGALNYVFDNTTNATVYYLPGTTGWDATYCGLPTAQWFLPTPQVLNHGSSFGVKSNQFGFIISWATNISVVVEACTNLANPAWFPVRTNSLAGGASYFSDPQWTNYPARLYRLRSP
jgi:hypothetical protein